MNTVNRAPLDSLHCEPTYDSPNGPSKAEFTEHKFQAMVETMRRYEKVGRYFPSSIPLLVLTYF